MLRKLKQKRIGAVTCLRKKLLDRYTYIGDWEKKLRLNPVKNGKLEKGRETERKKERKKERKTDRQTDRQTGRQADRQTWGILENVVSDIS